MEVYQLIVVYYVKTANSLQFVKNYLAVLEHF